MPPIPSLYADLYIERFGDPNDPEPETPIPSPKPPAGLAIRLLRTIFRHGAHKKATAWSFTLPIDRRFR